MSSLDLDRTDDIDGAATPRAPRPAPADRTPDQPPASAPGAKPGVLRVRLVARDVGELHSAAA